MTDKNDSYYLKWAWAWILGWTLFRVFYSGTILLSPDETNYWQWGRHLDWGYHDQAPLIGWLIRLSTQIFGTSEISVRLPSVLAMAVASAYIVALSGRWFGARAALAVALVSQGVLEFNVGGLLATADGIQAAGWAGASYHAARAFEGKSKKHWMATGFWFGFGLLSKFTMVLFGPCVLAFALLSAKHRPHLKSPWPWLGLVFGSLLFSPVLWWNMALDWPSARHVAHIGGADESFAIHWKYFGDFIGSQAALVSPLVFILVIWAWVLAFKNRQNWKVWYAFWVSIPMFAVFAVLSLHSRVYGNWPGAAYLMATVLAAAFFAPGSSLECAQPRPRLWAWTLGTAYLMTILVLVQAAFPVLPLGVKLDRAATELSGWDELGQAAGKMADSMPGKVFLFGLRYQEASELAFYAPGRPETVSVNQWNRPNVYDYWVKDEDLLGQNAVGVIRQKNKTGLLEKIFKKVDPPITLPLYRTRPFSKTPQLVGTYYLYRCYGFTGGLAWKPPESGGIRKSK